MVSYSRGQRDGLPPYVSMPQVSRSGGPNFLGGKHAPFLVDGYPNSPAFKVRDVVLPKDISESRAASRRELRTTLDRMKRYTDKLADDPAVSFDEYYQQSVQLVLSPQAQSAFDIQREPEKVREAYGRNDFAQRLLLARRLVEVGVSWVTVYSGGWDHHTKIFEAYKGDHIKNMDQGVAALISDLDERGLSDSTLVLLLGEFGRTPKVNKDAGRDHWPHAMSVLVAGAGVPSGHIIGATDAKGYHASEKVHSPEDFAASVYTKMGINPSQVLHTNTGRPIQLVNNGRLIKELFA
jgi:arylsulfatase A-like enzyme